MHRTEIHTPAGRFSALVWNSAPAGAPRLHFAHATGMHAGLYARLLAPLADRFHIVASDARGHGRSAALGPPLPPADRIEWEVFAADTLAITAAIDPDAPWLLAGHSMGGSASLLAAVARPARVAGLVLIDPPFIPFAMARAALAAGMAMPNPMAGQAGRRRAEFETVAAARAAWHGRGVFKTWSDADLDAYLADGLRPAPAPAAAGVTLACSPAWESATFRGVSLHMESSLAALDRPFALIAGETASTVPAAEFATFAAHPRCLSAQRLAGTTHFVPLERPEAVHAAVDLVATRAATPITATRG